MSISGKVALVTGAAQGLGKAFSEILLQNGAKVALTDFNSEQGLKTLSEFQTKYGQNKVMFMKCDVTSKAEMTETFETVKERLGGLDIVVNNAGVGGEFGDSWERTIDINLKGTMRGTILGIEHMRRDKGGNGGVIVNISSLAGVRPNPCSPAYNASKSAVIAFSQSWAQNPELAANGVRINLFAPAFVETQIMTDIESRVYAPQIATKMVAMMGIISTETAAEAFFELVDDQNKNGAILTISKAQGKEYVKV